MTSPSKLSSSFSSSLLLSTSWWCWAGGEAVTSWPSFRDSDNGILSLKENVKKVRDKSCSNLVNHYIIALQWSKANWVLSELTTDSKIKMRLNQQVSKSGQTNLTALNDLPLLLVVLAGKVSFFRTWKSTDFSQDFFTLNVGSSADIVTESTIIYFFSTAHSNVSQSFDPWQNKHYRLCRQKSWE